jgi:hypothetical protein
MHLVIALGVLGSYKWDMLDVVAAFVDAPQIVDGA